MGTTEKISEEFGEELFLTPLIEGNTTFEAREKARVGNLFQPIEGQEELISYSGFLTVDKRLNSNLFFWFFPAKEEAESAPLILWLQGGPGSSSLIGLFSEMGPYSVDINGNLVERPATWTLNHSVLYIDNPVGAGFSFTDSAEGYSRNQRDISDNLYECLRQFFQLFPEFRSNEFYISGQSYAGKYVPCLALKIAENQPFDEDSRMNLQGIIVGASFTDPYVQLNWGDHLYYNGLIDKKGKAFIDSELEQMREHIRNKNWIQAFEVMQKTMFGYPPGIKTHYEELTGLSNTCNFFEHSDPPQFLYYRKFLETACARRSLHIGTRCLSSFGQAKKTVFMALAEDMPKSCLAELNGVLELGLRVLLYSGQLDVVVPHTSVERLIRALPWAKDQGYSQAKRQIWRVNGLTAGYVKKVGDLSSVFIRNGGHMCPYDQPDNCLDMITRFTRREPFAL